MGRVCVRSCEAGFDFHNVHSGAVILIHFHHSPLPSQPKFTVRDLHVSSCHHGLVHLSRGLSLVSCLSWHSLHPREFPHPLARCSRWFPPCRSSPFLTRHCLSDR